MNTGTNGPAALDSALWALEEKFWTGNREVYERHLSPEAVMVFPAPAGILHRDKIVASIKDGPRWVKVEMHDPEIVRPDDSVAILTYRADASREGDASNYSTLASSTYTLHDGTWKLAFHQQTPSQGGALSSVRRGAWPAMAAGACALGATAVGALAIGRVAIGAD